MFEESAVANVGTHQASLANQRLVEEERWVGLIRMEEKPETNRL